MSYTSITHQYMIEGTLNNKISGELINVSDYISNIIVRKRFIQDVFPLFVIDFRTTETIRNIIRDNECSLHLKVSYFNNDTSGNVDGGEISQIVPEGIVLDTDIRIYNKPFASTVAKKDDDQDSNDSSQSDAIPLVPYRISGVPEKSISINSSATNNIFVDAEPIDALVHILSSVTNNPIVIQESDNKSTYKNIIIPPVNIIPALKLLQNNYIVYNDGMCLFFDTNQSYCISPFSQNKPVGNTVELSILNSESTGDLNSAQKPLLDPVTNDVRATLRNLPLFSKAEKVMAHDIGTNTIFYSYDEYYNIVTREESNDVSYKKTRYIWNETGIKNNEDDLVNIAKRCASLTLSIADVNPEILTPITNFRVISAQYPEAAGDYFASEILYTISTNDFKVYRGNSSLILIKK